MLERLDNFRGLTLHAEDGELGRVADFMFDDERWTLRYLVVRTSAWLGRNVLISPISTGQPNWGNNTLGVRLTRDQIRRSPEVPFDQTLAHEAEEDYTAYYGYADYWGGPSTWGWAGFPGPLSGPPPAEHASTAATDRVKRGLVRSVRAFQGSHVHARDGEIGHVDDAFVEQESWRIKYLLVDTSNWIGGRHVIVPTDYITDMDWDRDHVDIDLTRDQITHAPPYDAARPIDRVVEQTFERYYSLRNIAKPPRTRGAGAGGAMS